MLVYAMGKESEAIFSTFMFLDDVKHNYNEFLKKFDEHFVPKRNVIHFQKGFKGRVLRHCSRTL